MDINDLESKLGIQGLSDEDKLQLASKIQENIAKKRAEQATTSLGEHTKLVIRAIKKIEEDLVSRFESLNGKISAKAASLKDGAPGKDGRHGKDGRDGKDGRPGRDGIGIQGPAGRDGVPGKDGIDGVSVTAAKIDFDGSLIITLSDGREINAGEVVPLDLAERIKVITNGGGTSQYVLDTLTSLQQQIDAISGGGLSYQGTWNANTNTPTLTSSTGTNGYYYVVSVAGSTNLNGITDWQAGDWVIFNGTVWQKIDQSWAIAGANDNITSMTGITGGVSSPDFVQFDTGATVTNAAGRLYWDSTQKTLTVGLTTDIAADVGQTLYAYVTNDESVTINKGQPVYMYAAQGDRVSVKLAYNTGDATSAKTLGICAENIAAGQAGLVLCQGVQDGLDLSAYSPGDTLYLGATAGTLTATKPYAPNHLVYIGVVERANAGNGRLYVRVQNGYELDEIHNVSAQSPSNGQTIIYNATTSLWQKANLTAGTGISVTNGAGSITLANTGVTSVSATSPVASSGGTTPVISMPAANGTTDGYLTSTDWTTFNNKGNGTVTSVTGTSPVSSSGGTTPAISLASGYGDTQNPYASKTANFVLAAPNGAAGVPTFRAIVAADIPTLNQNTTGTASNVTGTVAIGNGGSGQTTAQAAMNAFAGAVTSGSYLRGNGTNVVMSTIQAADVPTLNQNTTGSAASLSATNFSIVQSGTKLLFRYNGTTIASIDSTGIITSATNIVSNGTP